MTGDLFPPAVDHRCRGCGNVHPGAREVTLHDGKVVSNYSEEWRLECEARSILAMPGVWRRQNFLALIEKKRGAKVADTLKARMLAIWELEKAAAEETQA